jgi:activator of Hsp90 ATPase-like protein
MMEVPPEDGQRQGRPRTPRGTHHSVSPVGAAVAGVAPIGEAMFHITVEDRYDTDIDDLWSAVTDPHRLARWFGQVEGDLRPGGQFRLRIESSGWDG